MLSCWWGAGQRNGDVSLTPAASLYGNTAPGSESKIWLRDPRAANVRAQFAVPSGRFLLPHLETL